MNAKEIIREYKKIILEIAVSEDDEDRLFELLDIVEDDLFDLEKEIERQIEIAEDQQEFVDYEQMNAEFVYRNCLPNNVF